MASSRTIAAWRRALLIAITTLTVLLALSFSGAADAHAASGRVPVASNYVGWATVKGGPWSCPTVVSCTRQPSVAWHWSGSTWTQSSLRGGTRVYAYPYSGSWHWAWTTYTGWLAVQSASLERDAPSCGIGYATACPRY
jgi:hypothetical protein